MEIAVVVIGVVAVIGLSAVTLAKRPREPCTACRRGELVITREFTFRCTSCGAAYRRRGGRLERA